MYLYLKVGYISTGSMYHNQLVRRVDLERGVPSSSSRRQRGLSMRSPQAQAELKFVYLVSCQIYGDQKKTGKPQAADILYLMEK